MSQLRGDLMEAQGDLNQLLKALRFAADKHRNQRRKDVEATPYINHPIAVAYLLCEEGGVSDLVTLQAALLHDTIEDTETTYEELRTAFGEAVADVVLEVTDDKTIADKAERKRLQLVNAPKKSGRAAALKLADKTCNLRDILATPPASWSLDRKRAYFEAARKVVDALPAVNPSLLAVFDASYASALE
jgi:guanosine-3',5'-bis(diphosphate) 3'-pyrophosphohydrolase